jgi:hypothetical protein
MGDGERCLGTADGTADGTLGGGICPVMATLSSEGPLLLREVASRASMAPGVSILRTKRPPGPLARLRWAGVGERFLVTFDG